MARVITLTDPPKTYRQLSIQDGAKLYAALQREVSKQRLLEPQYGFYLGLFSLNFVGLFISLGVVTVSADIFGTVVGTVGTAFFAVQIGGLVHDLGHRAVFRSPRVNDVVGYLAATLVALPYRVWCQKHNAHHAHTNEQEADPDMEIPFTFDEDRWKGRGGIVGFIRRHQHLLYYPFTCLAGFSFRYKGMRTFLQGYRSQILPDILLLSLGIFAWYILPFLLFPLWKAGIFFVVGNLLGGFYMASIFAPNHKGMPQLRKGVQFSFLEQQVVTSRNVAPSTHMDVLMMGLNYQIEHHLFPSCPRNKLPQLHQVVRRAIMAAKLPYVQMGWLETNRFIYTELRKIANNP